MVGNAVSDPLRCLVDRVLRKMGVARRRLDIVVSGQLADDRKGLAEGEPGTQICVLDNVKMTAPEASEG